MRRNRLKMVAAATVGAVALSVTGLAGTAQADPADDVQIMIDNLPAAVDQLVASAQVAAENFAASTSTEQLSWDVAFAVRDVVSALVAGTEQFGSLGLGSALLVGAPISVIQPYLAAFDADPASVVDLIDPNDITVLLSNLPAAVATAQPFVVEALIELLGGNLTEGEGLFGGTGTPAVVGSTMTGVVAAVEDLTAGSSFEGTLPIAVGVTLLVPAIATASYVKQVEDAVAPVFEALAPVTGPIADALAGV